MTCNPRSTSINRTLRYDGISTGPGKKFHFGQPAFSDSRRKSKSASVRKAGPMRLGEVTFVVIWPPVFLVAGLAETIAEPKEDRVGPEPLEPVQRLVQRRELLVRDAADLLHRLDVLLIERLDDAADFLALRGEADTDRTAIHARALMIEEAEFDQLLQIVRDVGAEVIAARAQLTRGQFFVADVIEQQ